ncbi:hypothetical protein D3C71_1506350 [compost metagenome]
MEHEHAALALQRIEPEISDIRNFILKGRAQLGESEDQLAVDRLVQLHRPVPLACRIAVGDVGKLRRIRRYRRQDADILLLHDLLGSVRQGGEVHAGARLIAQINPQLVAQQQIQQQKRVDQHAFGSSPIHELPSLSL